MPTPFEPSDVSALSKTIRDRCTTKAMDENPWPCPIQDSELIQEIFAAAGSAPFHKPAARELRSGTLDGIQPWRCYYLDATQCRELRCQLLDSGDSTKIPKMLAVADYLIQVTWLPNPSDKEDELLFDPSIQNMEHIAAASAAIQNMLLTATAKGIPNYWSSGGALRSPELFERLGIPEQEVLLGSLFLFPSELEGAQIVGGALRDSRSPASKWARKVKLS